MHVWELVCLCVCVCVCVRARARARVSVNRIPSSDIVSRSPNPGRDLSHFVNVVGRDNQHRHSFTDDASR